MESLVIFALMYPFFFSTRNIANFTSLAQQQISKHCRIIMKVKGHADLFKM